MLLIQVSLARRCRLKVWAISVPNPPSRVCADRSELDIHEPYPLAGYAMSVGLEQFKKDQFEGALSAL